MPGTVNHVLTATTPDDPGYEIRPSHWNSSHAVTFNAVGSEISGAFDNAGGVTFGLETNGSITAAAPAGGGGITNINVSAGTTSNNLSRLTFANSNGISFGLSGSVITGTVATNYLTTAALSNHSHGASGSNGSFAFQTLSFSNANGISFGTSAGNVIIASHNALTTARASNDAVGLNTALTAGPLAWTVNSNGISLNAGSAAGTTSGFAGNLISGSMTHNTAGLNLSLAHPTWLTTAMASNAATISNINISAGTTSTNASAFTFSNANNVSFGLGTGGSAGNITASASFNQTNQSAIKGLGASNTGNTLGNTGISTGIDWVIAGTGALTVSQSTVGGGPNTLWLNAPSAAAGNVTFSAGANSSGLASVIFSNANNVSFGLGAGSVITASASGGGGGGIGGGVSTGGNTAGSTGTITTGNIVFVGASNITLSQSTGAAGSNATVSIIAPNSSSLVGVAPIGLTTNGSTVSVTMVPISNYKPFQAGNNSSFSTFGQNTLYLQFFESPLNLSLSVIDIGARGSFVSSSNNQAHSQTISYGLYSRDTGTNSTRLSRVGSSSIGISVAYSSNTSGAYTFSGNATSATAASGGTALFTRISGPFALGLPFATTIPANVHYAVAIHISTTTAGNTGPWRFAPLIQTVQNSLSYARINMDSISAPNATILAHWEMGAFATTTNAFPATIAYSDVTVNVSRMVLPVEFDA